VDVCRHYFPFRFFLLASRALTIFLACSGVRVWLAFFPPSLPHLRNSSNVASSRSRLAMHKTYHKGVTMLNGFLEARTIPE
jgi:hypothetical protein